MIIKKYTNLNDLVKKSKLALKAKQFCIIKNFIKKRDFIEINKFLKKSLPIKKIYTCYCENNKCKFRKPNSGMLRDASNKYKINLNESFVVGDRWKDIEAGKNENCRTIFIDKSYNEKLKTRPDFSVRNFSELRKIFKF